MAEEQSTLETFYKGWEDYQAELVKALAPLTPEQLALSAGAGLRSIGMLATHMVGARARWLREFLGEGGDNIAEMATWDRGGKPARNADELVHGVEATWQLMRGALARWTPSELAETIERERHGETESASRQWVIWHLIEHDLHHGGELSYSLGMHGLRGLDL